MSVEAAGPELSAPNFFRIVPSHIRRMAGYIIDKCVVGGGGIGGFVTDGWASVTNMVGDPPERSDLAACT